MVDSNSEHLDGADARLRDACDLELVIGATRFPVHSAFIKAASINLADIIQDTLEPQKADDLPQLPLIGDSVEGICGVLKLLYVSACPGNLGFMTAASAEQLHGMMQVCDKYSMLGTLNLLDVSLTVQIQQDPYRLWPDWKTALDWLGFLAAIQPASTQPKGLKALCQAYLTGEIESMLDSADDTGNGDIQCLLGCAGDCSMPELAAKVDSAMARVFKSAIDHLSVCNNISVIDRVQFWVSALEWADVASRQDCPLFARQWGGLVARLSEGSQLAAQVHRQPLLNAMLILQGAIDCQAPRALQAEALRIIIRRFREEGAQFAQTQQREAGKAS